MTAKGRLQGIDVARFMAFAGMVLVNFRIAAMVDATPGWTSVITTGMEGRAAALFVVLAGLGFAWGHPDRGTTVKRAIFLIIVGLLNMLIFDADILHFYGLYFLVALAFMGRSTRILVAGALAAPVIWVLLVLTFDYETSWDWDSLHYDDFWTVAGFIRHSLFNGWHPVFPWIGFFLAGMWLGRQDLGQRFVQLRLVILGGIAWVGITVISRWIMSQGGKLSELAGLSPIPPGPLYLGAATASAFAAIGLILLLTPTLSQAGLADWFARPGRQTLTLYVAHIYLGMGVLDALGWLDGSLTPNAIFALSTGFCAICMIYAALWQKIQSRGPLEWAMRKLTE